MIDGFEIECESHLYTFLISNISCCMSHITFQSSSLKEAIELSWIWGGGWLRMSTPPRAGCMRLRIRTLLPGIHHIPSVLELLRKLWSTVVLYWGFGRCEPWSLKLLRGSGATTQQVSKRLQSELMTLMMSGDKVGLKIISSQEFWLFSYLMFYFIQGISAFPDGDNLLSWIGE